MGDLKNYFNSLKGKSVAVVGAGISNTPLIGLLLTAGIETTVCDKRSREELGEAADRFEAQGAKLRLGDGYLDELDEDVIFRTPGLMPTNPFIKKAVERGAILTSEMEVFFDICPCKIIAVTGSEGKTTTTSIIARMLENDGKVVHLGGNIGTPLLSIVDKIKADDIAVVELSSFQLITMQKSPDIALVTNISPNHLDIHSDMDEYIDAKSNIFMHQTKFDRAVFNMDNESTRNYAGAAPAGEILFFSMSNKVTNGVCVDNGIIYESKDGVRTQIMQIENIILPGKHNIENYLAACTAVLGIASFDSMVRTAKNFRGVEHRLEFVRELHGVKYYNDSKASSPGSAIAGIRALTDHGDLVLIAGGKDKGIPFNDLGAEIADKVKILVLTGATANMIHEAIKSAPNYNADENPETLTIILCDDFEDAVIKASEAAKEGDIVLLSPACTSFDRFNNFEERGNKFKDIVNRLV